MSCFILGSGTFATAIGWVLASKGKSVTLWCRRQERADEINGGRHGFLPDLKLPDNLVAVTSADAETLATREFEVALSAVPTQLLAGVVEAERSWLPRTLPWVSLSKGVEVGTFRLPSGILRDAGLAEAVSVISGPSHAEEVVQGVPTAVVLGDPDGERGRHLQELLSGDTFRVYLNTDVVGVEWGGALKNVIALACGIAAGCGFGDNSQAALVTRGAVEMARLGVVLGGKTETFSGLSGIGDLIVTCFSEHSRNRGFGYRVGAGELPETILRGTAQAVEGVHTVRAVVEMCRAQSVEMPIAEVVHGILHEGMDVRSGVHSLLRRSLKEE